MNADAITLIEKVLVPLLGNSSSLISDLASGVKSIATAKAEIGSAIAIAQQRLDSFDVSFASTDTAQDARVAAEQKPKP